MMPSYSLKKEWVEVIRRPKSYSEDTVEIRLCKYDGRVMTSELLGDEYKNQPDFIEQCRQRGLAVIEKEI